MSLLKMTSRHSSMFSRKIINIHLSAVRAFSLYLEDNVCH